MLGGEELRAFQLADLAACAGAGQQGMGRGSAGYKVSERGRILATIIQEYEASP